MLINADKCTRNPKKHELVSLKFGDIIKIGDDVTKH